MFIGRNQRKANRQISWWESVRDHPPRMERQMRYPVSSWEKSHNCWPLFSWGSNVQDVFGVCGRELSNSAGEGASEGRLLLNLLFVERGLVGDAGRLGITGITNSWRSKEGDQQNCHLGPPGDRLWPVQEPG